MKTIIAGIFVLVVLLEFATPKRFAPAVRPSYPEMKGDSGYIKKGEAFRLLVQAKYEGKDTLDMEAENYRSTDTIGKYYRMDNGNYLAFLRDISHTDKNTFVLMETAPDGTVLQSEPYYAGFYQCCWGDGNYGFKKYANGYYGTESCGTGSGHCSSYIYFFKGFSPQGNTICSYVWTGWCVFTADKPLACHLTSDVEIKNDTITMHYTLEHKKEGRNDKYKTVYREKFDVKYVEREQGWIALDSTKIREFPM